MQIFQSDKIESLITSQPIDSPSSFISSDNINFPSPVAVVNGAGAIYQGAWSCGLQSPIGALVSGLSFRFLIVVS